MSIRVSEAEYALLRGACDSAGARNVSELARVAVDRLLAATFPAFQGPRIGTEASSRIPDTDFRLEALTREVERLAKLLTCQTGIRGE